MAEVSHDRSQIVFVFHREVVFSGLYGVDVRDGAVLIRHTTAH